MTNILNQEEIKSLIACGKILKEALDDIEAAIKPGVKSLYLDEVAEKALIERGAYPAFKNYPSGDAGPFPASLCVSVNEEVVHGIPMADKIIHDGDIVSIDLGAYFDGVYTDAARTIAVGKVSPIANKLIYVTKQCLEEGLRAARAGNHIGSIGSTVQRIAEKEGFNVVRDLVGHGIGRAVHLEPNIPNFGKSHQGPVIENGMALAIEPMVVAGNYQIAILPDGWTIRTRDNSLSAHFEHTVVVIDGEPVIAT